MSARSWPGGRGLYAIADFTTLAPKPPVEAIAGMAAAGVRWIQVRAKEASDEVFCQTLKESCRLLVPRQVDLWVDDRADLAALFPVAGLHLGQQDLPPSAARRLVGEDRWLGLSTHNLSQLRAADADPDVDVVALGPIFATESKENPDPVVGLDVLRHARRLTAKPLVAIGGIDAGNIRQVLEAGADWAAVLGAVCRGDVVTNSRRLVAALEDQG